MIECRLYSIIICDTLPPKMGLDTSLNMSNPQTKNDSERRSFASLTACSKWCASLSIAAFWIRKTSE